MPAQQAARRFVILASQCFVCSRCKREIAKQNFKLGCVGFGLFALNIAAGALNFLGRLGSVVDKKASEIRARQKASAN